MKELIKLFSNNRIMAHFIMVVIFLFGISSWFRINTQSMPTAAYEVVLVKVPYPFATPLEVEKNALIPIERALTGIGGVRRLESYANEGLGMVFLFVNPQQDVKAVEQLIKKRIESITGLPEEVGKASVYQPRDRHTVMFLAVTSDHPTQTLENVAIKIRDSLLRAKNPEPQTLYGKVKRFFRAPDTITAVEIIGHQPSDIFVEVSQENLINYHLSLEEIAESIRTNAVELSGGIMNGEQGQFTVRTSSTPQVAAEILQTTIQSSHLKKGIDLENIATLTWEKKANQPVTTFNGKSAIFLRVDRIGNQDILALQEIVTNYLEKVQSLKIFPDHVGITAWHDQSIEVRSHLELMKSNGLAGGVLVLLALTVFFRPSLAWYVALGIPFSIAGAVCLMPYLNVTINTVSLFGFIVVLGIVVDDAIVVAENIYTYIERGVPPHEAAWKGAHDVGVVVIFGVLTTVVAFCPLLTISGATGQMWDDLPLVVIPTLLFSLLQAKLVLPAQLSGLKQKEDKAPGKFSIVLKRFTNAFNTGAQAFYLPVLNGCLQVKYLVCGGFVALLIGVAFLVYNENVKWVFLPEGDFNLFSINITLHPSTSSQEAVEISQKIRTFLDQVEQKYASNENTLLIKNRCVSIGNRPIGGEKEDAKNMGQVAVELIDEAEREVLAQEFAMALAEKIKELPRVVSIEFEYGADDGKTQFQIDLISDRREDLFSAIQWARKELYNIPEILSVSDSSTQVKDEIKFTGLTEKGKKVGLTTREVANYIKNALQGCEVYKIQGISHDTRVVLRLPKDVVNSVEAIDKLQIKVPAGGLLPITEVATFEYTESLMELTRTRQQASFDLSVGLDQSEKDFYTLVKEVEDNVLKKVKQKYPQVSYQLWGGPQEEDEVLKEIGLGYLTALVMMYILMAIALKSYTQPLIIMSIIPFGAVGAVIGHMVMGIDLSLLSFCGVIALSGIVINDSLVLLEQINNNIKGNMPLLKAVQDAGVSRFRAIVLTSLTTFCGVLPMMLDESLHAQILVPMAVSLGFGILFTTVLMLILVPCIFLVFQDLFLFLKVRL